MADRHASTFLASLRELTLARIREFLREPEAVFWVFGFPVIMTIIQFQDLSLTLSIFLMLTLVQFLIGNFWDPFVMGKSLNLSPFAILVSLAIWSELWGVPGAFLAVPITAILAIVLSEFSGTRPVAVLLSKDGSL